MLEISHSLENDGNNRMKRKRVSDVPHRNIAPAAKKAFVSTNICTHSDLNEASELHCSVHGLLSISENSPSPSSPDIVREFKDCIMVTGIECSSDCISDDSDDSICTIDSGVETDDGKKSSNFLKPILPVVDFVEGTTIAKPYESPFHEDGFVRRMANLNARARFAVLFHEGKYKKKRHSSSAKASVESITINKDYVQDTTATLVSSAHFLLQPYTQPSSYETVNCSLKCYSTNNPEITHGVDEDFPCNIVGLLYDGRTVHPSLRVFLQNGKVPSGIIPLIVPASMSFVYDHAKNMINESIPGSHTIRTARRGDNGWSCYGEPIKTVQYRDSKDKLHTRRYYIGVKRKDKIIFVRNCICAKSGMQKPFVAKIASIWQETGGVMMTLFWYYRPDEVQCQQGFTFIENELLASQHHDENTVACIEDKCYVLGLREYCRYKAAQKRQHDSLGLPSTSLSVNNLLVHRETSIYHHWHPTPDVDPALIFLCYQGYNHITGKVLRTG